jgi:hypothetical protein
MTKLNKLGNIIQNKWGHRVILYLLAHRTKLYFSNETLRLLAQGDEIRTRTRHVYLFYFFFNHHGYDRYFNSLIIV